MEKITERLCSEYTCYPSCSETVVYFDGKPVMKVYTSFFQYSFGKKTYSRISPEGWVKEISRSEFYDRLEELKAA